MLFSSLKVTLVLKNTLMFNVQTFNILFHKFRILFLIVTFSVMKTTGSEFSEKKIVKIICEKVHIICGMSTLSVMYVNIMPVHMFREYSLMGH